jgi:hypothetical protein
MLNKFQVLVNTILENMNAAGAGGSFGTPQQPVYSPDNPVSGNTYAPNDNRNVTGAFFPAKGTKGKKNGKKIGKKIGKKKVKPLVIRRTLPSKAL